MTNNDFLKIREELDSHCSKLLNIKSNEYSPGDSDRLIQFHTAAVLLNVHPAQALAGMMAKHETSLHMMISSIKDYSDENYSLDQWKEKIGDLRNYCDLLWALLAEV